jgi:voltage-dependent anion channel protein 2
LTKWGYVGGYVDSDYAFTARGVNNCAGLELSYYQKVNSDTEVAIKSSSTFKTCFANAVIEAGAKYTLDSNAFVKVKTNSQGILGLGYTQNLRPGLKLSIGGLFDTARLQENVHKLGVSLNIEA